MPASKPVTLCLFAHGACFSRPCHHGRELVCSSPFHCIFHSGVRRRALALLFGFRLICRFVYESASRRLIRVVSAVRVFAFNVSFMPDLACRGTPVSTGVGARDGVFVRVA